MIDNIDSEKNFLKSIDDFTSCHTQLFYQEDKFSLLFKKNAEKNGITIMATDFKLKFFVSNINYIKFCEIRKGVGLEGNFSSFFEILRESIKNYQIKLLIEKDICFLQCKYILDKGIFLNSKFNLGKCINFKENSLIFNELLQNFSIFLSDHIIEKEKNYESENFILNEKIKSLNNEIKSKGNLFNEAANSLSLENKNKIIKKPKARTDLINPNLKRRKQIGAKFEKNPVIHQENSDH